MHHGTSNIHSLSPMKLRFLPLAAVAMVLIA